MTKIIFKTETRKGTEVITNLYWKKEEVKLIPPEKITIEIDFDPCLENASKILRNFLANKIVLDETIESNGDICFHEKTSEQSKDKKTEEVPKEVFDVNLEPVNYTQKVKDFLLNNPNQKCTARQISRTLGIENSLVNSILLRLRKNGFIQRIERGIYRLSQNEKEKKSDRSNVEPSKEETSEESNGETLKDSKFNEEPENLKMVKEILEDYPKIVEYILTKKTFSVKALRRKFLEIDVVSVIKAFNEEVIQYYTFQDDVYTVSPKWRIWYYLLKKSSEKDIDDIKFDLKFALQECQKAIEEAIEEKLIIKVETDEVIKYSIKSTE